MWIEAWAERGQAVRSRKQGGRDPVMAAVRERCGDGGAVVRGCGCGGVVRGRVGFVWRGDRGAGTIWVLAFAAVIWVGGVAAVAVGGVRGARHRADAAADMAALAGAGRLAEGAGGACAGAKEIAVESGARLKRCRVQGDGVEVLVTVDVVVPMGVGAVEVMSRARAGPVGREGVLWRDTFALH